MDEVLRHQPSDMADPEELARRLVERGTRVQNGDRVEIYRPLELDPREARRQLASLGRTMREG